MDQDWSLEPNDQAPVEEGGHRDIEKNECEEEGKDWNQPSTCQGNPKDCWQPSEIRKRSMDQILLRASVGQLGLLSTLIFGLVTGTSNICYFEAL